MVMRWNITIIMITTATMRSCFQDRQAALKPEGSIQLQSVLRSRKQCVTLFRSGGLCISGPARVGARFALFRRRRETPKEVSQLCWLERTANTRKVRGSSPRGTTFFLPLEWWQ